MCECLQDGDGGRYLCPVCYGMACSACKNLDEQVEWYRTMRMPNLRLRLVAEKMRNALQCTPE